MDQLAPPAHLRACSTLVGQRQHSRQGNKESEQRAIEVSRQQRVLYLKGKDGKFCKREYIFF
jgi:hypothetical protein